MHLQDIGLYDWMPLRRYCDHSVDSHVDIDMALDLEINSFLCFKVRTMSSTCEYGPLTVHILGHEMEVNCMLESPAS
jgi:hypothetical protein